MRASPAPGFHSGLGLLAGRCLMGIVYLHSGVTKLTDPGAAHAEFAHFGLPSVFILPTIALQIGGAVALMSGFLSRLAALALAVFTLAATLVAHAFWTFPEAERGMQTILFLEHLAIIGGLLLLASVGPGRLAITLSLFRKARS